MREGSRSDQELFGKMCRLFFTREQFVCYDESHVVRVCVRRGRVRVQRKGFA